MLSPNAFVQQPIRWLNAISRVPRHIHQQPEFRLRPVRPATTPEQRAAWTLELAGGAQRRRTSSPPDHGEFAAMFAPCGFRREAMFPAYGLAEATLVVSGGPRADDALLGASRCRRARARSGRRERQRTGLARHGRLRPRCRTRRAIVDPATAASARRRDRRDLGARPGSAGRLLARPRRPRRRSRPARRRRTARRLSADRRSRLSAATASSSSPAA